jgi:hypothetical protein
MRHPDPVNVVHPAANPYPDHIHDLATAAHTDPRRITVVVRPGSRRPRRSDLGNDILNALGRPGTSLAVRKNLPDNLALLVPFLASDDVTDLLLFEPAWLRPQGCEDLIAIARLASITLWLVLSETPDPDLADLLAAHQQHWWTADQARHHLSAAANGPATPPPTSAQRLGQQLTFAEFTASDARRVLADRVKDLDHQAAYQLHDDHGRDTLRLALRALHFMGHDNTATLRRLRVADLAPDGRNLTISGTTVAVPPAYRRALLRQRLHATMLGQHHDDQLLTIDGAPVTWDYLGAVQNTIT